MCRRCPGVPIAIRPPRLHLCESEIQETPRVENGSSHRCRGQRDLRVQVARSCWCSVFRLRPNVQANRRAALMATDTKRYAGPGSCTALIDTWLRALLPLEGDGREVA